MMKMRRKDRAVSDKEAIEILHRAEYGVLSMMGLDGEPYGAPLSFCYVNKSVYFHSANEGHKLDCIQENARVSFCAVGKTEIIPEEFTTNYESTIVFGQIEEALGDDKQVGLEGLVKKYSGDWFERGLEYIKKDDKKMRVFKINIDAISGKARKT